MSEIAAAQDDLLQEQIDPHKVGTRTDSAAMLAWFLQNVWRIDPEEVDESICDGGGDKGIDALLVEEDAGEITVVQAKYRESPGVSTQGDKNLKELVGAADWFKSSESVDALLSAGPNRELRSLILRQEVRERIASGDSAVRLVFVTNAKLDASGKDYVSAREGEEPPLAVWDRQHMVDVAERTKRPDLRAETVVLDCNGTPIEAGLTANESMAIGIVRANQLITLPGIDDGTLFSRNVRLFAGRTRINRDLKKTVESLGEHRLFPAYHNGLTLLTNRIQIDGDAIHLDGVGVVNGCQSLITLHENSSSITDELQVLIKVVEIGSSDSVADLITYRSNNQNSVTLRDQRSSDGVMRDLRSGVQKSFGKKFALKTRLGEDADADAVMENTTAAQLILAVYLEEPWAAVRKVRLFDQDYRRIFSRSVTPHRLWLLHLIDAAVGSARGDLRPDLRASFASVKLTLAYLVARVLHLSKAGKGLLDHPESWLPVEDEKVAEALGLIAREVVDSVNYHVKDELARDEEYDPKVAFKSKSGVGRLESDVHRDAKRQAERSSSYLFTVTPADPAN